MAVIQYIDLNVQFFLIKLTLCVCTVFTVLYCRTVIKYSMLLCYVLGWILYSRKIFCSIFSIFLKVHPFCFCIAALFAVTDQCVFFALSSCECLCFILPWVHVLYQGYVYISGVVRAVIVIRDLIQFEELYFPGNEKWCNYIIAMLYVFLYV